MKQKVYGFEILAAILATITLSGLAAAVEGLPFKSQSSGVNTVVGFDPVENIVHVHGTAKGEATYLGRFTASAAVDILVAQGTARQTMTLTASNGDILVLAGDNGHGIDPTHWAMTLKVVGGTGRFQGATGSCEQTITFAVPPPHVVIAYTDVLEGTISFGPQ